MNMRAFALFITLALLAGCATSPGSAPPTAPPSPTAIAAAPPTTAPAVRASDAVVKAARFRLSRNGLENPDLVSVVRITAATWADDCLGLPSGVTCHATPTPGYVVELERDGKRYLVHVDQDGKQARLAGSPAESLPDTFIQWQYSDGRECRAAVIGTERVQYGVCGEAMLATTPWPSLWPQVNGQSQADYLKHKYAPFTANTIRGTVVFSGTGTTVATEAEQRAIAEWASGRFDSASYRYLAADYGLRLRWREESASLCGGLWIYQNGLAVAWNCGGSEALRVGFLSATQLQQFYTWLDSGKRWEVVRHGQGEGPGPTLTLSFAASHAGESATDEDIDQVLWFARGVYAVLTGRGN